MYDMPVQQETERLIKENERLARKYRTLKAIGGRTPWTWGLGIAAATICFCFSFYYEVKQNTVMTQKLSIELISAKAEISAFQSEKVLINHRLETLSADVKDIKGDIKVLLQQTK